MRRRAGGWRWRRGWATTSSGCGSGSARPTTWTTRSWTGCAARTSRIIDRPVGQCLGLAAMRTRDPDAKREALLDAGATLADELGLGQLSVNRIIATAGVAKGSFFHHFGDRAGFFVELHRRFHDRLAAEI